MIRARLIFLIALLCIPASAVRAADAPPNIVLILADDLGYNDISLHGNKRVRTPNIDAIGADGVWFTRGHTTAPVCAPSRAGLLTGRNQQMFGFEFVPGPAQLFIGLAGGEKQLKERGANAPIDQEVDAEAKYLKGSDLLLELQASSWEPEASGTTGRAFDLLRRLESIGAESR